MTLNLRRQLCLVLEEFFFVLAMLLLGMSDIGWNDFGLRNYDPQVGRWVQSDPYKQFACHI